MYKLYCCYSLPLPLLLLLGLVCYDNDGLADGGLVELIVSLLFVLFALVDEFIIVVAVAFV